MAAAEACDNSKQVGRAEDEAAQPCTQMLVRELMPVPYQQMPLTPEFRWLLRRIGAGSVRFPSELQNFDIGRPPSNWLRSRSFWEQRLLNRFLQHHTTDNDILLRSFGMGDPYLLRNYDVVSHADNIKRLMKMAYSKQSISMLVHRVGRTLFIDAFDALGFLLRNEQKQYAWLRSFLQDTIVESKNKVSKPNRSRCALQQRDLMFKLLYYIAQQFDKNCSSSAKQERQTSSASDDQPRKPLTTGENSVGSSGNNMRFSQEKSNRNGFENHCETLEWHFDDLEMLFGTDLAIFGSRKRPAISVKVRDREKPITVLTGIDFWLDNLMCNVPELAMVYHVNGVLNEFELLKTEQIPLGSFANSQEAKFEPSVLREIATDVLAFLRRNATHEGHTYWLFKPVNSDVVKLYDLTSLYDAQAVSNSYSKSGEESSSSDADDQTNLFAMPVALLLYRMAFSLYRSSHNQRKYRRTIRRLLENCLKLLSSAKVDRGNNDADRDLVLSANYILSDLLLPDKMLESISGIDRDSGAGFDSDMEDEPDDEFEFEAESESTCLSESEDRETVASESGSGYEFDLKLGRLRRTGSITVSVAEMRVPDPKSVTPRRVCSPQAAFSSAKLPHSSSALLPAQSSSVRRYELALNHALACISIFQASANGKSRNADSCNSTIARISNSAATFYSNWLLDPTRPHSDFSQASQSFSRDLPFDCASFTSDFGKLPNRCAHATYLIAQSGVPLCVLVKASLACCMLARAARSREQFGASMRLAQLGLICSAAIAIDRQSVQKEVSAVIGRKCGIGGVNLTIKERKRLGANQSDVASSNICTFVRLKAALQLLYADACAHIAFADSSQSSTYKIQFEEAITATQSRVVADLMRTIVAAYQPTGPASDTSELLDVNFPQDSEALRLAATFYSNTFELLLDDATVAVLCINEPTQGIATDAVETSQRKSSLEKELIARQVTCIEQLLGESGALKRYADVLNELGVRSMRRVETQIVADPGKQTSDLSVEQMIGDVEKLFRRAQMAFDCVGNQANCAFVALNRARLAKLQLHSAITHHNEMLEREPHESLLNDSAALNRLVNPYKDAVKCFSEASRFIDVDQRSREGRDGLKNVGFTDQIALDCANLSYQLAVYLQEIVRSCKKREEETGTERLCVTTLTEALEFANQLPRNSVFTLTRIANLHYRVASIGHDAVRLRGSNWPTTRLKQCGQLCRLQYEKALAALNDTTVTMSNDKCVRLRAAIERLRVHLELAMFEDRLARLATELGVKISAKKSRGLETSLAHSLLRSVQDALPTVYAESENKELDEGFCEDAMMLLGALAKRVQANEATGRQRQVEKAIKKAGLLSSSNSFNKPNIDAECFDRLLDQVIAAEQISVGPVIERKSVPKLDSISRAIECLLKIIDV